MAILKSTTRYKLLSEVGALASSAAPAAGRIAAQDNRHLLYKRLLCGGGAAIRIYLRPAAAYPSRPTSVDPTVTASQVQRSLVELSSPRKIRSNLSCLYLTPIKFCRFFFLPILKGHFQQEPCYGQLPLPTTIQAYVNAEPEDVLLCQSIQTARVQTH